MTTHDALNSSERAQPARDLARLSYHVVTLISAYQLPTHARPMQTKTRRLILIQHTSKGLSAPHQHVGIPQQHSLIPADRGHPASHTKQTPVHARDELCMTVHDAHLLADPGAARPCDGTHRGAVVPQADRHVVAGADENVAGVWAPGDLADGVLVALHEGQGPAVRVANIKGADDAVDAGGGDDGVVVLVPVVGEELRGGGAAAHAAGRRRRGVHGDRGDEMVLGGRGRAQVK